MARKPPPTPFPPKCQLVGPRVLAPFLNSPAMIGARRWLGLAEGYGLGTRTDCPGVSFGRDFDQADLRRNYLQRLFPGQRAISESGHVRRMGP